MKSNQKAHWEQVYTNKTPEQVSWTQAVPQTSLTFIQELGLSKSAKIIDVGGGDSNLVDHLLREGFQNITVLDISEAAMEKAKARLGYRSHLIKWIISDITEFKTNEHFDLWHDRATFHFLTGKEQIETYLETAAKAINGYMVIGTFSNNGPTQCSGLPIKQYTEEQLETQLNKDFRKIRCIQEDHITPFQTRQNFLFCSFSRLPLN